MRASGLSGELRYGYQRAARLGRWTLEGEAGALRFAAEVEETNEAWMARRPLVLVVALASLEWTWQDVEPAVHGDRLVIALAGGPAVVGAGP